MKLKPPGVFIIEKVETPALPPPVHIAQIETLLDARKAFIPGSGYTLCQLPNGRIFNNLRDATEYFKAKESEDEDP